MALGRRVNETEERKESMDTATAFVIGHESDPNRRNKTTNVIALAITRSLGRKGVKVVRVQPNLLDYGLSSKYCGKIEICPNHYESEEALANFLNDMATAYDGKKVLIPASDDSAHFLGKWQDELRPAFAIPVARKEVIERVIDKKKQFEDAERLGIPIPETYFPADMSDARALAKEIRNYPYIFKPTIAHKWRLASMRNISKGRKAVVVNNAEELLREYEQISEGDRDVMLQRIVPDGGEGIFTFLSYFTENSEPAAYCVRKKLRQKPIDFGYCTSTMSCHDDTVVEQSIRLLQGIGYHGIGGVEYKHDPRTGRYELLEINARAVNTVGIAEACGVNLPYIAYKDMAEGKVEKATSWEEGVVWLWLSLDFRAAMDMRKAGRLTVADWLGSLRGKRVHAVFAADDMMPAAKYYPAAFGRGLRKWITKG